MSFRGRRNWPPEWIQTPTQNSETASGEVGILEEVCQPIFDPSRCYLTIKHNGQSYFGVLRFDSIGFCQKVSELLLGKLNQPITEIAASDIVFTS